MKLEKTSILPRAALVKLIETAKNAELCRDLPSMRECLREIWDDVAAEPDLSGYGDRFKAEMLRLAGAYLSFYGHQINAKDYQIRGKNLLTHAIDLFDSLSMREESAEAGIMLAHCYYNAGETAESEIILEALELEFGEKPDHPVYLRLNINRLLTAIRNKDFKLADRIIENIKLPIEYCGDLRLKVKFYTNAGIVYSPTDFDRSAVWHKQAIEAARQINNQISVALNLNNLAFLSKEKKDFGQSLKFINEAIEIVTKMNHRGWLAHFLDTRALINLDSGNPKKALETTDRAVELFREGEDAAGLCDALWTRVRCRLALGETENALSDFIELHNLANDKIGEKEARSFAAKFIRSLYPVRGLPLGAETRAFEKSLIRSALIESGGKIVRASQILQMKNHQTLSKKLDEQFPEIYDELGLTRRIRSSSENRRAAKNENKAQIRFIPREKILLERPISQMALQKKEIAFDFDFGGENVTVFHFFAEQLAPFGISEDSYIAVAPIGEYVVGRFVVVSSEREFHLGRIEFDAGFGFYFIADATGMPIILDETNVKGAPVAFCPLERAGEIIRFSKLV